jgi:hypothetical protein
MASASSKPELPYGFYSLSGRNINDIINYHIGNPVDISMIKYERKFLGLVERRVRIILSEEEMGKLLEKTAPTGANSYLPQYHTGLLTIMFFKMP